MHLLSRHYTLRKRKQRKGYSPDACIVLHGLRHCTTVSCSNGRVGLHYIRQLWMLRPRPFRRGFYQLQKKKTHAGSSHGQRWPACLTTSLSHA